MTEILNRKIKLTNIDGLGDFNKELIGVVVSQSDRNHCVVKLGEELVSGDKKIGVLNISTRHKGKYLDMIVSRGSKKFLNIHSIVAVSVVDENHLIGFMAEIEYEGMKGQVPT